MSLQRHLGGLCAVCQTEAREGVCSHLPSYGWLTASWTQICREQWIEPCSSIWTNHAILLIQSVCGSIRQIEYTHGRTKGNIGKERSLQPSTQLLSTIASGTQICREQWIEPCSSISTNHATLLIQSVCGLIRQIEYYRTKGNIGKGRSLQPSTQLWSTYCKWDSNHWRAMDRAL